MKLNLLRINPAPRVEDVAIATNQLLNGGSNAIGTIKLTPSSKTTTLRNNLITSQSVLFFFPQTADAQAVASSLWYDPTSVPVTGNFLGGQITLNHSSSANTDMTFGYVVLN